MLRQLLPIVVTIGAVILVAGCLADLVLRPKVPVKMPDGNFEFREEPPKWR